MKVLIIIPATSRVTSVAAGGRSYAVGAAPGRDGLPQGRAAGIMIKAAVGLDHSPGCLVCREVFGPHSGPYGRGAKP